MWHPFKKTARRSNRPHTQASAKANRAGPAIESLEGRTLYSFSAPITSAGGGDGLAVGDINNDHRADVIVFAAKGRLAVSLSNGDGTFRPGATLSGLTGNPFMIFAPADLNGDGRADVSATGFRATKGGTGGSGGVQTAGGCLQGTCGGGGGSSGTIYQSTWLGNGDGTFGPPTTTSGAWTWGAPSGPSNPTTAQADFNRDGIVDSAAIQYWTTPRVTYFALMNADGSTKLSQTIAVGSNPRSIAAGDVTGDGWADLIVVNSLSSGKTTFSVLLNDRNW